MKEMTQQSDSQNSDAAYDSLERYVRDRSRVGDYIWRQLYAGSTRERLKRDLGRYVDEMADRFEAEELQAEKSDVR